MRPIPADSPRLLGLLGALSAMVSLSIDMGLPALPALAVALHAPQRDATLTLSLFLAGFALAQLGFGPWGSQWPDQAGWARRRRCAGRATAT